MSKGFTKGNRLWELRDSSGPKLKYDSPKKLWEACVEYFQWVEDNPLWEAKVFAYQGEVTHTKIPKMRAMTNAGLCLHLGITQQTWADWRRGRDDLFGVITTTDAIIRDQKFTGAAADLLNANIISRDLGLAEKQDHQSSDGTMTPKPDIDLSKAPPELLQWIVEQNDKADDGGGG